MSVDIGRAVEDGGRRTLARNGLAFTAVFWMLGIFNGLLGNAVARNAMNQLPGGMVPDGGFAGPMMGPALGIPPAIAGLLSILVGLATTVLGAAAIRTFVTDERETIPGEHFTRNLVWMVINLVVGGIVFALIVGIGFVLLVIPGIFLLVSLFFWNVYVIVEDQNFIDGFQNSWALTRGNRLMLFLLGVIVIVIAAIVGAIFGIPRGLVGGYLGLAIAQIGGAFGTVFTIATAARTYRQLTPDEPATGA